MKRSNDPAKATLNRVPDPTGRDGAIDFVAKAETSDRLMDDRLASVMGSAVIDLWADLPRDMQEVLFEHAVQIGQHGGQDDALREQLARYLHDQHKRTGRS